MSKLRCHSNAHPGSPAPLITWSLHASVIALMVWKVPALRNLHTLCFYLYWCRLHRSCVAATAGFYFAACYQDPGYVESYVRKSGSPSARSGNGTVKGSGNREDSSAPGELKNSQEVVITTDPGTLQKKSSYQRLPDPPEIASIESIEHAGGSFRASTDKEDSAKVVELAAVQVVNTSVMSSVKYEDAIVVQERFCTVCEMLQPLRAKHCKDCRKCVALHDHHCPWLGNCVGEKNRFSFYWYLVCEGILLYFAMYLVRSRQRL